jgi:hypothetical protein
MTLALTLCFVLGALVSSCMSLGLPPIGTYRTLLVQEYGSKNCTGPVVSQRVANKHQGCFDLGALGFVNGQPAGLNYMNLDCPANTATYGSADCSSSPLPTAAYCYLTDSGSARLVCPPDICKQNSKLPMAKCAAIIDQCRPLFMPMKW